MPDATQEQLDLLLSLQATDARLRKLQHQLDDLPEQQQLDATKTRVNDLEREYDDLNVEADRVRAQQRQYEREVDVLTQRRDAERERLYNGSVANAREMKAVEAEIETTIRRISEHEDLMLEALESTEQLDGQLDELKAERGRQSEHAEQLAVDRDAAAKGILAEQAELQVQRDQQAAGLPDELLSMYDKASTRPGGTAVGKLEGNACTACRIEMSMADVGELYAGPPLTTCPQCRRLLVVPL